MRNNIKNIITLTITILYIHYNFVLMDAYNSDSIINNLDLLIIIHVMIGLVIETIVIGMLMHAFLQWLTENDEENNEELEESNDKSN